MDTKMKNILAVGAHPDDIELGCSATLFKHHNNGANVHLLILSMGEASGNATIREDECQKSAALMGVENLFFGGMEDTRIGEGFDTIKVIEEIIDKVDPDLIYTHTYKDTHQDHRNTAYASLSAGRRCKKIFMYESPTTLRDFSPHVFIDVNKEFENKKKVLALFKSQSLKEGWAMGDRAVLAVEGLAAYRGFQAGVRFAEAFEVGRLVFYAEEPFFNSV